MRVFSLLDITTILNTIFNGKKKCENTLVKKIHFKKNVLELYLLLTHSSNILTAFLTLYIHFFKCTVSFVILLVSYCKLTKETYNFLPSYYLALLLK